MRIRAIIFLLVQIILSKALADVEILAWKPSSSSPTFILPQKQNETAKEAIDKYIAYIHGNSEVTQIIKDIPWSSSEGEKFWPSAARDKILFVANHRGDLESGVDSENLRVQKFMRQFPSTDNFVLALGATERLRANQRKIFHQKIIDNFAGLILMGGHDVSPQHYNEEVTYAREINPTRDRLEIALIQDFVQAEKGFVFGVCRGSQITSVALGYKLIQDIPQIIGTKQDHADLEHPIIFKTTTNKILENALGGFAEYSPYSWHHQSIIYKPGGLLELAAVGPDGVTEALEFKNGLGLLVQFHPELRQTKLNQNIIKFVARSVRSKTQGQFSCRKVMFD